MADILKVLGQVAAPSVTPTLLYAVPALSSATTSSLVVCNRSTAGTFRISIRIAGAGASNSQFLFFDAPLAANSTLTAVLGMTLAESDEVYVYASTANFSFNLFGVETR